MRLTVACPVAFMDDANDLAMVLAFGPADAATYENPSWVDAEGNYYAVASFDALPSWVEGAQTALARPVWDINDEDEDYVRKVNMAGAGRAQALLYIVPPVLDEEGIPTGAMDDPLANPDRITIMPGEDGLAALASMGLSRASDDYVAPVPETVVEDPAPEEEPAPEMEPGETPAE